MVLRGDQACQTGDEAMLYEERTYTLYPGTVTAFLSVYEWLWKYGTWIVCGPASSFTCPEAIRLAEL
jgi:hypothetical protein